MPVDRDSEIYNMNHRRRGIALVFNHKIKKGNFKKNSVLFFPISNIRLDLHLIPNCGSCDDDELLDVIITSSSSEESLSAGANPKS